jgi:hypothetical protein
MKMKLAMSSFILTALCMAECGGPPPQSWRSIYPPPPRIAFDVQNELNDPTDASTAAGKCMDADVSHASRLPTADEAMFITPGATIWVYTDLATNNLTSWPDSRTAPLSYMCVREHVVGTP